MPTIRNIALFIALFPAFVGAQIVPNQNQVTQSPFGGLVYATSTSGTAKLGQLKGSAFGDLTYWNGTSWATAATSTLGIFTIATSTLTPTSPLTGSFVQIGSGGSLGIQAASGSQGGYLTLADWTNFNSKQAAITWTYPLQYSAGIASLAFGTTTDNTWSGLQTFTNVGTTSFAGGVSIAGDLQVNGNAYYPITFTSGPVSAPYFTATSTTIASTFPSASTTNLSVATNFWATGITSAVGVFNTSHLLTAASTQTCTNQFIRALSAAYIATCATVSLTADVTGTLPVANGGTATTTLGVTNGILYNNGTNWTNGSVLTWNAATSLLTATNASTTNLTASTLLWVPNSTAPSLASTGLLSMNTTAASSSLNYYDGTVQGKLFNVTELAFTIVNSPTSGQGTTTIEKAGNIRGFTLINGSCFAVGGTANVQVGNGSASTTMLMAGTGAQSLTTLSSNNSFQSLQPLYVAIGTFSSSATTTVSCSYGRKYDY